MLLSPNEPHHGGRISDQIRSLVMRGRYAEAARLAQAQGRRGAAQCSDFLDLRAEIALGMGRFASALRWAGEGLKRMALDPQTGSPSRKGLEASRIKALLGLGRFREAEGAVASRFAPLEPEGEDLCLFLGQIALRAGRLTEALQSADQACQRAVSARRRTKVVEALLLRARAQREAGAADKARADLDRAQRLSNGLRNPGVLARVLSERADLMAHAGDWVEAQHNASQSGRLFARTFSPDEHLSAGRRRGLLGLAQGDPNEALPSIEKAADVARRGFGTTECRAEIDLLRADARMAVLDPEGALDRASAALLLFRCAQDPGGLARAHVRRSLAALSVSNIALARREARIAGAVRGGSLVAEGLADLALGRVLLRQDRSQAAEPFGRAAENPTLYPPLRSVARIGVALASGVSPQSDCVRECLEVIARFGDQRILGIVRSDLREVFGMEMASSADPATSLDSAEALGREEETGSSTEFLPGLIGVSAGVRALSDLVKRAAPSDVPVSIYGETGTGKEKIARAVHDLSNRAGREFVAFNAASVSDELFDSEIFGHVRGSFTGAHSDRPGLVELARGGTLFIDEIADLSPRSQVRLLRFLQEGTYRRLGENHERRADVRVVVAANQPLENLVASGRFREDLFYRVRGFCVIAPPLRERGRDIVRLARHFVHRASRGGKRLSPSAEAELQNHVWPGNVRELEMEMKRAVVLGQGPLIEWRRPRTETVSASMPPAPAAPIGGATLPLHEAMGGYERSVLKSVLARCAERVEAARQLGISRQALHQKIVRYGL